MTVKLFADQVAPAMPHVPEHSRKPRPEDASVCLQQSVLLVEPCSDVFDGLARRLSEWGMRILRASTAASASCLYLKHPQSNLIVNVDLPDHSGWLLVAKLRLTYPSACAWLYGAEPTPENVQRARFVGASGFLFVGSKDCERLAEEVIARVAGRCSAPRSA
jgi:DNA-binding NtrC family response regulator